jgi:hypothetical protein
MSARRSRDGRRWMSVGRSAEPDARTAAAAAAHAALVGPRPKLLVVFAAVHHDGAALLAGVQDVARDVPTIGCSTHGEIAPGGPSDGAVVVAALGGPGFSVATATAEMVSGRQRAAGAELASCVGKVDDLPYRVLMLLTDGLVREQETVLRGCYNVLGASIPLFGGAAAEGFARSGPYVLGDGRMLRDAAVAVTIASEAPLSVAVRHGWRTVGEPMIVTSSADGWVYTLDDQPALDVFLDRLDAPREAYIDADEFINFALPRPLGVQRRSGVEPRNLGNRVDIGRRAISSGTSIDHGGLTWVMTGDEESILAATDTACAEAVSGLGECDPVGLFTFSCSALRPVLGEAGVRRENERMAKWAEGAPVAGFYTYGEIARVRGIDGFHNQALAVLAFG